MTARGTNGCLFLPAPQKSGLGGRCMTPWDNHKNTREEEKATSQTYLPVLFFFSPVLYR